MSFFLLSAFLVVIKSQRILEWTSNEFDFPVATRYLGCDVDESTNDLWCLGGWTNGGAVYRFNPSVGWEEQTSIPTRVDTGYVFNAEIVEGVMYFVSGQGDQLSSYDLDTQEVSNVVSLTAGNFAEVAAVDENNILYITCGDSTVVERYDINRGRLLNSWNSQSEHYFGTAKYYQNRLYILGGRGTTTNKLEYTDVDAVSFVTSNNADNVPDDYDYLTSVVTEEGFIYVIGGQIADSLTDMVLLYNIAEDRVRDIAVSFPSVVYGSDCVLYLDAIWCMAGYDNFRPIHTVHLTNDLAGGQGGKGGKGGTR